jgi:hypothetical protein
LAKHEQYNGVDQITEEAHVREMARQHVVQISPVNTVHTEREIVHETKRVVCWPNAIQEVKQCVESNDGVPNIALRKSIQQISQIPVELLVEISLRHL